MSIVDVLVIGVGAVAAARGWVKGLVSQVFEFGGGFLGLVVGVALGPRIAGLFTQRPGLEGAVISIIVVLVLVSIGQAAGFVVGHRSSAIARRARLGGVNQGLGAGFAVIILLVSFWIVGSLLVQGPSRPVARAMKDSAVLRGVNAMLPDPPNLLAYFSQYLRTSGFPQVFSGLPPSIGPRVDLPPGRQARAAFNAADQSTVRVIVPACGGTQLGSGWVSADSTVVTNAHVVAGGDEVTVQDEAGEHAGTVVVYDARTDIAVLHVEGVAGPPLALETQTQERGAGGATLGYPGGGDLQGHRAAVQGSYPARGLDIYGREGVERDVYELRAPVRQGDSGGPFVLSNGDVAGVVFAGSTTDGGTGYALTGAEVQDEVQGGAERTEAVSTGACTH
jgi:S1-C subfamily serine protease